MHPATALQSQFTEVISAPLHTGLNHKNHCHKILVRPFICFERVLKLRAVMSPMSWGGGRQSLQRVEFKLTHLDPPGRQK
jgi:hypothetical protein